MLQQPYASNVSPEAVQVISMCEFAVEKLCLGAILQPPPPPPPLGVLIIPNERYTLKQAMLHHVQHLSTSLLELNQFLG